MEIEDGAEIVGRDERELRAAEGDVGQFLRDGHDEGGGEVVGGRGEVAVCWAARVDLKVVGGGGGAGFEQGGREGVGSGGVSEGDG